jgi:hypothetical protein
MKQGFGENTKLSGRPVFQAFEIWRQMPVWWYTALCESLGESLLLNEDVYDTICRLKTKFNHKLH